MAELQKKSNLPFKTGYQSRTVVGPKILPLNPATAASNAPFLISKKDNIDQDGKLVSIDITVSSGKIFYTPNNLSDFNAFSLSKTIQVNSLENIEIFIFDNAENGDEIICEQNDAMTKWTNFPSPQVSEKYDYVMCGIYVLGQVLINSVDGKPISSSIDQWVSTNLLKTWGRSLQYLTPFYDVTHRG